MWFRRVIKSLINKTVRPLVAVYLSADRGYRYHDIQLIVLKGVFHPGLFFSTKILLNYLEPFDLNDKTFLESGAGSGLISIYAAKKKARVTASDISGKSIKNIKLNAAKNNVVIKILLSDLFEKIPATKFDFIVINPPYYKRKPKTEEEFAWYCGEHLEYFKKLFRELSSYVHANTKVIMVLSEDCDLEEIKLIALQNKLEMILKKKYFRILEMNYVFEIAVK